MGAHPDTPAASGQQYGDQQQQQPTQSQGRGQFSDPFGVGSGDMGGSGLDELGMGLDLGHQGSENQGAVEGGRGEGFLSDLGDVEAGSSALPSLSPEVLEAQEEVARCQEAVNKAAAAVEQVAANRILKQRKLAELTAANEALNAASQRLAELSKQS